MNKILFKIKIPLEIQLSYDDFENIIVTALEGGIGYWCVFDTSSIDFDKINELNGSTSVCVAKALWIGEKLRLEDCDDEKIEWFLNRDLIVLGIKQYITETKDMNFIENMDVLVADKIIQYALFGVLVYG